MTIGHIFERIWGEPKLLPDLLRGPSFILANLRLRFRPDFNCVIQPSDHIRHPARPDLDNAAAKIRETIQNTIEHQRRDEPLGGMMDHCEVFGVDDLCLAASHDAI